MMTNVSCRGDKPYVQMLGLLAKRKGVSIGVLVRNALDKAYSEEMAEIEPIAQELFFVKGDAHKHQSISKGCRSVNANDPS